MVVHELSNSSALFEQYNNIISGFSDTTTCDKPTINGGSVSPSTATIATGAKYTGKAEVMMKNTKYL